MKKWTILVGLLWAGLALAQSHPSDRQGFRQSLSGTAVSGILRSDSTARLLTTDTNGNLYMQDYARDRDANFLFPSIISNAGLAAGAADSSGVLDTHAMRIGTLLVKAVPTGTGTVDSTVTVDLGIQIRTHLTSSATDSNSTFAWYMYGVSPSLNATATASDTAIFGQLQSGSINTAWSGEFLLRVSAKRSAHANSVDVNGHTFYYPNGMAIPLQGLFGREIYSPYTSVRVRVIRVMKGIAALTGGTCAVTVHLVGSPL